MQATELRGRFGARLLAARRTADWRWDPCTPVPPGRLRLHDPRTPPYQLLSATTVGAWPALRVIGQQTRSCAINLGHRVTLQGLQNSRPTDHPLAARGVDVRSVYDPRGIPDAVRAAWTENERDSTREGYVPQRLIVYDRVAVVMDGPPVAGESQASTWLVTDPEVVVVAAGLFDNAWRMGRPVAAAAPSARLTDRQRALIPLLLSGRSEAAIARDLGVATRTVTYEVSALMTALGANGRVDLGYHIRRAEERDEL